jgi:hypothetical protein
MSVIIYSSGNKYMAQGASRYTPYHRTRFPSYRRSAGSLPKVT